MDVSELRQVVEIFTQEGEESLTQFEMDLRAFGNEGGSEPVITRMLQRIRHIKGSAAALGFAELADLTQQIEFFLLAIAELTVPASAQTHTILCNAHELIREHLNALRTGAKSPGKTEALKNAMAREREMKKNLPTVQLPRPMAAGDIWFVSDDLKAELFEIPEPITTATAEETPPPSPSLTAIQAEIARLTRLAASVNFTSIQNATAIDEATSQSGRMKEWSLEGIEGAIAGRNEESDSAPLNSPTENMSPTNGNSNDNTIAGSEIQLTVDDKNDRTSDTTAGENQSRKNSNAISGAEEEGTADSEAQNTPIVTEETSTANAGNPTTEDSALEPHANIDESLHKKIEIPLPAIDIIQNRAKDLIVLQSILDEHKEFFTTPLLQKTVAQLSKVVQEMQAVAGHVRDVSMESSFSGWRNLIEDLATTQRKDIQLTFKNESTRLDVEQLETLNVALLEYLRHTVEERIVHADESMVIEDARPTHLVISAQRKSHALVVEVRDDIARTEERAGQISTEALSKLHEAAASMRGTLEVSTLSNAGAAIQFIIPERLDVTDGLVVRLGNERFVIQKSKVAETLLPQEADVYVVQGQTQILNLRGMTVPLLNLADLLQRETVPPVSMETFSGLALINMENSRQPFAVVVEEILTEQRIVVRRLGAELQGLPGLAGAAVLGDGKPAILLDLMELMNAHRSGYLMRRQGKAA